ncbi:MAG TPA: M50 family metallopeptidase [Actinomycetota bacterium]|nr:M50 family metallopeptidase [Actinomycetota bacterium]
MDGSLGIVGLVVALIAVIVVHELAHFGVAKAFGIMVTEFFVGFGPRIWSTRRGETEYGVKWIPAGGYVKIAGMNPYETVKPEDLPRTFGAKPIWQRALVIVAGPATHFVLAFVLFALWLGLVGEQVPNSPIVSEVAPTLGGEPSPASVAGLQAGDRIVRIGDIDDPLDSELVAYTREHVGEPIAFVVERDGERFTVTIAPVPATVAGERVGRIGVLLDWAREERGVLGSLAGGANLVVRSIGDIAGSLGRVFGPEGIGRVAELVFTDAPRQPTDAGSLVAIGQAAGQTASAGNPADLLALFAFVNVVIGFLNLLPLPPFDGGHLAVLAIEKVRGKPVDMRKVVPVSLAVATFFIVLTVSFVYLDIVKPIPLGP